MSKKPDDAARIAGLANILGGSNKQKVVTPPPSPAPLVEPPADAALPPGKPRKSGRVGKSSDPNFHHYGVYLRKATHKQAKRRLEDLESGMDLSELLQKLLEEWLTSFK